MAFPTALITILSAAVDAMSVAGGYNFDYGPVDVFVPEDRVYPQVYLEFPEEEPVPTQVAGRLTMAVPLTFKVYAAAGAGDLDAEAAKVVTDIKRMMEATMPALQAAGMVNAEPVSATWVPRLVRAYPAEVRVTYRLEYRQNRAEPGQM